ncbi:hypothetical protein PanWU01x14_196580 [Parasponia andersonii]|uniref:Uncharacterized protein n=1 Tax=Parasponia andersonii TaxID=3476 RepID=A0A2P5BZP5_PARAD|nr:hypothetical protein PanWU01x14_196580 [Parasponia andersonii]
MINEKSNKKFGTTWLGQRGHEPEAEPRGKALPLQPCGVRITPSVRPSPLPQNGRHRPQPLIPRISPPLRNPSLTHSSQFLPNRRPQHHHRRQYHAIQPHSLHLFPPIHRPQPQPLQVRKREKRRRSLPIPHQFRPRLLRSPSCPPQNHRRNLH